MNLESVKNFFRHGKGKAIYLHDTVNPPGAWEFQIPSAPIREGEKGILPLNPPVRRIRSWDSIGFSMATTGITIAGAVFYDHSTLPYVPYAVGMSPAHIGGILFGATMGLAGLAIASISNRIILRMNREYFLIHRSQVKFRFVPETVSARDYRRYTIAERVWGNYPYQRGDLADDEAALPEGERLPPQDISRDDILAAVCRVLYPSYQQGMKANTDFISCYQVAKEAGLNPRVAQAWMLDLFPSACEESNRTLFRVADIEVAIEAAIEITPTPAAQNGANNPDGQEAGLPAQERGTPA